MGLYKILSFFLIYSCLGWGIEVAYQALSKGIIVNRGFLNGPLCPIYGFGVLAALVLLHGIGAGHPEEVNAFAVFMIGMCLATAVELLGGWVLDKLFHARWWDYRSRRFNLNGYICPEFSICWGLGVVILIRVVHPFICKVIFLGPVLTANRIILLVLYIVFIADVTISVLTMTGLNKKFAELDELRSHMRTVSDRVSTKIGGDVLSGAEKVDHVRMEAMLARAELRDDMENARKDYHKRRQEIYRSLVRHRHFGAGRMLLGNPVLKHREYIQYIEEIRREMRG